MPRLPDETLRTIVASFPSDRAGVEAVIARAAPRFGRWAAVKSIERAIGRGEVELYFTPEANVQAVVLTPLGAYLTGVCLTDDSRKWVGLGDDRAVGLDRSKGERDDDGFLSYSQFPSVTDGVVSLDSLDEPERGHDTIILGIGSLILLPAEPYDPRGCPIHPGRLPRRREWCLYCEYRGDDEPPSPRVVQPRRR